MTNRRTSFAPAQQISDPLDYYVEPPKDGGAVISLRIDRATRQRIEEIVQSRATRFTTASDLGRAAVVFFISEKIAPKMDGRFQADVRLATTLMRKTQTLLRVSDAEKFHDEMAKAVKALYLRNQTELAVDTYLEAIGHAEASAEPFRSIVLEKLRIDPELEQVRVMAERRQQLEGKKSRAAR